WLAVSVASLTDDIGQNSAIEFWHQEKGRFSPSFRFPQDERLDAASQSMARIDAHKVVLICYKSYRQSNQDLVDLPCQLVVLDLENRMITVSAESEIPAFGRLSVSGNYRYLVIACDRRIDVRSLPDLALIHSFAPTKCYHNAIPCAAVSS